MTSETKGGEDDDDDEARNTNLAQANGSSGSHGGCLVGRSGIRSAGIQRVAGDRG